MEDNILKVKNKKDLNLLLNHKNGEIAQDAQGNMYVYSKDRGWVEFEGKIEGKGIEIKTIDLTRQMYEQLGPCSNENIEKAKLAVEDWVYKHQDSHYLLYGKEVSYFTLFEENNNYSESLVDLLFFYLQEFGILYDVIVEDGGISFWIKDRNDFITYMAFFCYGEGVIYYGG